MKMLELQHMVSKQVGMGFSGPSAAGKAAAEPTGVQRTALNDQPWMVGPVFQAKQDAQLESIHGGP